MPGVSEPVTAPRPLARAAARVAKSRTSAVVIAAQARTRLQARRALAARGMSNDEIAWQAFNHDPDAVPWRFVMPTSLSSDRCLAAHVTGNLSVSTI